MGRSSDRSTAHYFIANKDKIEQAVIGQEDVLI